MGRLSKEAADDKKLIDDNPNASAKQLLALGLSQSGYEKLLSEQPEPPAQEAKSEPAKESASTVNDDHGPVMPTVERQAAAVPKLQSANVALDGDMVTIISPEGTRTPMTRKFGEKFHRRNPNYQIEG